ncbi:MAG: hypothetical protein AAF840_07460 [Bacteroidota bacterium]
MSYKMATKQLIDFKREHDVDRYFFIKENPESVIHAYFAADEFAAGIRLQISRGTKKN